jgi:hypothetical protein
MRPVRCAALFSVALVVPVSAKLPPSSSEANPAAAETSAKAAWVDKVGAYQLCLSQDRVAAGHRKSGKAAAVPSAGSAAGPTPASTQPCTNPGPYVSTVTPVTARPLESSEAHSPPGTATSPPSTNATSAEMQPKK